MNALGFAMAALYPKESSSTKSTLALQPRAESSEGSREREQPSCATETRGQERPEGRAYAGCSGIPACEHAADQLWTSSYEL